MSSGGLSPQNGITRFSESELPSTKVLTQPKSVCARSKCNSQSVCSAVLEQNDFGLLKNDTNGRMGTLGGKRASVRAPSLSADLEYECKLMITPKSQCAVVPVRLPLAMEAYPVLNILSHTITKEDGSKET